MSIFRQLRIVSNGFRWFSAKAPIVSSESNERTENLASMTLGVNLHKAINQQINAELVAGYTYLSISYHFSKSSVGLMGFSDLYRKMSKEEMEHAENLAQYLLKRNGSVELGPIGKPPSCSLSNIGATLNETLRIENCVSESLSTLYRLAEKSNDPITTDFIVMEFLNEQIESIRSINLLVARWKLLEKAPNGVYLMDRELRHKNM